MTVCAPPVERYVVQVTEGWLKPWVGGWVRHRARPLSAHVLDTHRAHRVIATFRTETYVCSGRGVTNVVRREKTVAAAQALADQWNAEDAEAVA